MRPVVTFTRSESQGLLSWQRVSLNDGAAEAQRRVIDVLGEHPPMLWQWSPATQTGRVSDLIAAEVAGDLFSAGYTIVGINPRQANDYSEYTAADERRWKHGSGSRFADAEPVRGPGASWADLLFTAVGSARREAVFKALTKVLHPDNPSTGSTELMQTLNRSRERW